MNMHTHTNTHTKKYTTKMITVAKRYICNSHGTTVRKYLLHTYKVLLKFHGNSNGDDLRSASILQK